MKTEFKFKNVNNCEAVVLTCIDFRFWKETLNFIENELGIKSFDFPSLPGSAKAINESEGDDLAMKCISVPFDLHDAKKVVIVNHGDCGAYGGAGEHESIEAEQEFHLEELKKAEKKILDKHREAQVILVYARLNEVGDGIEFVTIEDLRNKCNKHKVVHLSEFLYKNKFKYIKK